MANLVDCNSKISELFYILKAEVRALRGGELNVFAGFTQEKTDKLKQLSELLAGLENPALAKTLEPQLGRLQKLSIENGIILKSVYNGIKSAQERLLKIKNEGAQVGAYGRSGGNLYFQEQSAGNEKTF